MFGILRTSMLKVCVFPNNKNMIRINWFCIVLTANTVYDDVVYMKPTLSCVIVNGLHKTGYDVDVTVVVGCYCFHI